MKILFVLENYFPNIGGVETLFRQLTTELVEAGHECTVITSLLHPDHPRLEKHGRLTIVRIPVSSRYLFTVKALRSIFRYIRSADLVQTTSYNAALPAFLGGLLFRKKVVVTFHEAWGELWFQLPFMGRFSKLAHYLFEQLLLRLPFSLFVAVSQSTARRLQEEGVHPNRIKVIYNGLNYTEFADRPEQKQDNAVFTYTYFGRLGISKGLDLLLEAARQLKDSGLPFRLQLITPLEPEDLLDRLKQVIAQYTLEDHIIWQHHLPFTDLKRALLASDSVVIPSYSEGFCYAAAEAAALGVPIISSARGALPEVVSGRFIDMASLSVNALTEAMHRAAQGEWEEKPLVRFELQDTVAAYMRTYSELGRQ